MQASFSSCVSITLGRLRASSLRYSLASKRRCRDFLLSPPHSLLPKILILRTCQARVSQNANSAETLVSVVPKNAKNAQRGREQARDNPAADRGSWPPWRCNVVALVQSSKSFAMRTYAKCFCKCPGMSSYRIIGLKVPWNEQLQERGGGRLLAPFQLVGWGG